MIKPFVFACTLRSATEQAIFPRSTIVMLFMWAAPFITFFQIVLGLVSFDIKKLLN